MNPTTTFITFGSHANYIDAGNRLLTQANSLNIFTNNILYTGDTLKNDKLFWDKHSNFVNNDKRGYGYWLWKSYLIKKTMEQMKDGNVLLYLDCGCEIDIRNKEKIFEYLNIVKTEKLIATTTETEKIWNKMDLIKSLNMDEDIYLNKPQHQATAILFLVCDETKQFVNEWYDIGCNYHNIDDSPSIIPNLPCFREHRHDQSIFSLLSKKYKLIGKYSLYACINLARNRGETSRICT